MQIDPSTLIGPVGGVPIVIGIVQGLKQVFPRLPGQAWPAAVLAVALGWNEGVGYYLHLDPALMAIAAVLTWLAAEKVYEHAADAPPPPRG